MPGCTLPRHLGLEVRDQAATSRGGRTAHGEARVGRGAADRIEAPGKPGALPGPCLCLIRRGQDVRGAINDETRIDRRAADIEHRLLACPVLLDRPVATVDRRENVGSGLAAAGRDTGADARARDSVQEVWRHGLEGPAAAVVAQDDTVTELGSNGVAAIADRAREVQGEKGASPLAGP